MSRREAASGALTSALLVSAVLASAMLASAMPTSAVLASVAAFLLESLQPMVRIRKSVPLAQTSLREIIGETYHGGGRTL